jgi:hypothetical protein
MPTSSIPAGSGGGLTPKYQKFTSSGTFTLPDGYGAAKPLLVQIQVIGGGGGGMNGRHTSNAFFTAKNTAYTQNYSSYFGNGQNLTINAIAGIGAQNLNAINDVNGFAGGSGGIVQSQLYLTSNLTITVGAAGTRATATSGNTNQFIADNGEQDNDLSNYSGGTSYNQNQNNVVLYLSSSSHGGAGGTTTAGSLSATGGQPSSGGTLRFRTNTTQPLNFNRYTSQNTSWNFGNSVGAVFSANATQGPGGQPAGNAGAATPVLGTVAGGSGSNTPIYGSFGISGIKTDGATSTGVEGTGGAFDSAGSSGAVILTWWQ